MRPPADHFVESARKVVGVEPHIDSFQPPYLLLQVHAHLPSQLAQLRLLQSRGLVGHEAVISGTHRHEPLEPPDGLALRQFRQRHRLGVIVGLAVQLLQVFIFVEICQKPYARPHQGVRSIADASVRGREADKDIHQFLEPLQVFE